MSRPLGALALVSVLLAGCSVERAAPPAEVPAPLRGTWRGEQGYLALGGGRVVVREATLGTRSVLVTAVAEAGDAVVVTLGDGRQLLLAPGRALRTQRWEGQDLVASCAFIDVTLDEHSVRLWDEERATWLPRPTAPTVAVVAPVPAPTQAPASADERLLSVAHGLADPRWAEATRDLLAVARTGAGERLVEDQAAEVLRRQRLAALDLLAEATGAEDPRIAAVDRLVADAEVWRTAVRTWGGRP